MPLEVLKLAQRELHVCDSIQLLHVMYTIYKIPYMYSVSFMFFRIISDVI